MRRALVSVGVVLLLSACGGDDSVTPVGNPDFTLTASVTSQVIPRGVSATTTLTLFRKDGYASTVALSAEGVPAGVTVTFVPPSIDRTTSTSNAIIAVSTTAAAGTVTMTFRGVGSGATDKTVQYQLTVLAP